MFTYNDSLKPSINTIPNSNYDWGNTITVNGDLLQTSLPSDILLSFGNGFIYQASSVSGNSFTFNVP